MRVALIGMPGSGKTTVFNAIAPERVDVPPGTLQTDTHVQVVTVKDDRLDRCREIFQPKKFTPAGLEVWDPPGMPTGGTEKAKERRMRLLHTLRDADAYVLVVRAFENDRYPYERPEARPEADLQWLVDELLAADFLVAEGRIQRLRENLRRGVRTKDQDTRELAVLEKAAERLETGQGLKDLEIDEADAKRIRGYQFFARKPLLLLLNGPDANLADLAGDLPGRLRAALALDAQLEAELAAMDPAERPAFQEEFGIEELAADRFVHEVYRAVGLISSTDSMNGGQAP